jgi:hypothetical protein
MLFPDLLPHVLPEEPASAMLAIAGGGNLY